MKKSSKKLAKYLTNSQRLRYADDEAKYPWLSALLDTYHIIDAGTSIELREEEKKIREEEVQERLRGMYGRPETIGQKISSIR
ncbi:MAG: hypothetical protein ACXABY_29300 [Candidatus Thorarchaeota archaeon]